MNQTTNTILMIRPINFRMNEQTAVNNYYQQEIDNVLSSTLNSKAQNEFDAFVDKLRSFGIHVIVVSDSMNLIHLILFFPIIGFLFIKMVLLVCIQCSLKTVV